MTENMEFLVVILIIAGIFTVIAARKRAQGKEEKLRPSVAPIDPKRVAKQHQDPSSSPLRSTNFKSSAKNDERSTFNLDEKIDLVRRRTLSGPAWVTDGDTLKIKGTQIRLFGIDAPEIDHPFGKKAKWALHKLCKDQTVRAEITAEDEYGRTVAQCFLPDGRDLSAEMVKLGMAIDWPKFSNGKYTEFEVEGIRKKLFLADARQKGRIHMWERYNAKKASNK